MRVNIFDASVSILLVYILLPRSGISGYIACIFVTEILNCALSLGRLLYVTGIKLRILARVASPAVCVAGACSCTVLILNLFSLSASAAAIIGIVCSLLLYLFFLISTGTLGEEERFWLKKLFFKG